VLAIDYDTQLGLMVFRAVVVGVLGSHCIQFQVNRHLGAKPVLRQLDSQGGKTFSEKLPYGIRRPSAYWWRPKAFEESGVDCGEVDLGRSTGHIGQGGGVLPNRKAASPQSTFCGKSGVGLSFMPWTPFE
jgi:hypothetical protein